MIPKVPIKARALGTRMWCRTGIATYFVVSSFSPPDSGTADEENVKGVADEGGVELAIARRGGGRTPTGSAGIRLITCVRASILTYPSLLGPTAQGS